MNESEECCWRRGEYEEEEDLKKGTGLSWRMSNNNLLLGGVEEGFIGLGAGFVRAMGDKSSSDFWWYSRAGCDLASPSSL